MSYTPDISTVPPVYKLSTTGSFDFLTVGSRILYTVPTGKTVIIQKIITRYGPNADLGIQGVSSLGTNSNVDNMIATMNIGKIEGDYQIDRLAENTGFIIISGGQSVRYSINTAPSATSGSITVDLFGYLI